MLEAVAAFAAGHRLAVMVLVDTRGQQPLWLKYRFQFMDSGNASIFRYDMAPHHGWVLLRRITSMSDPRKKSQRANSRMSRRCLQRFFNTSNPWIDPTPSATATPSASCSA
ncbi:MAG: toxin-antitoxin system TumE family protein [Gammaproteobacteria bacterium]